MSEGNQAPTVDAAVTEKEQGLLDRLTVGTVIDGKYRIDELIGRGAMGVVVSATHEQLHEKVALKFLEVRTPLGSQDFKARFRREAQVSARLKNEHITRVIDVGLWRDEVPFMVMDHLVGRDLRTVIRAEGKLSVPLALDYVVQICEGLAEAHAIGVVHRDLKPSNLFLTQRADGSDLIKILDFGISKWSKQDAELDDELTQTGVVLGSPKYMAPEQLFGSGEVDARADVWSLGAILYQLLGGRPPFDQPTLAQMCAELSTERSPPSLVAINADVSDALEQVIFRCFARDRSARVQDVAELAFALLEAVGAPFADPVRTRIRASLTPGKTREATASGPQLAVTGGYAAAIALGTASGSWSSIKSIKSSSKPVEPSSSEPSPPPKRRGLVIGAVVAIGLISAVAWISTSSRSNAGTTVGTRGSTSTSALSVPSAPTTTAATAIATTTATTITTTSTTIATPTATPEPIAIGKPTHPYPPKPTTAKSTATTTATTTIETTPTTTTASPPPPPPPPPNPSTTAKKGNPLEERL